jgi:tetratricopeptide (TPR) repeat protein
MLGNSYLFNGYYYYALENYNIALKNDPNNYLCLKYCAYGYTKNREYSKVFKMLDELLKINKKDSLILCYYGEILCNMKQYSNALTYFTKVNTIDPENTHNLNKRAIAYYILQEYDKVLLDLNKVIQLEPLNNLAHYLMCLTYYTKKDINNAIIVFKKYTELVLDYNNILAKTQLFHLEYLLNKNSSQDLIYDILAKINQVTNIKDSKLLLLIRCKLYIELKMYHEAKLDLYLLYTYIYHNRIYITEYISYIYLLQECMDFWSYIDIGNNNDFSKLGIVDEFSKYMYESKKIFNLLISYLLITIYILINNELS